MNDAMDNNMKPTIPTLDSATAIGSSSCDDCDRINTRCTNPDRSIDCGLGNGSGISGDSRQSDSVIVYNSRSSLVANLQQEQRQNPDKSSSEFIGDDRGSVNRSDVDEFFSGNLQLQPARAKEQLINGKLATNLSSVCSPEIGPGGIIKPTKKRYFILLMFITLHIIKSFQWICLASITNVVAKFYGVDNLAINCSTVLFMVTFLIFSLPVSWIMDLLGLRRSLLIGSIGVTTGVVIKCFSCRRDAFALSMLGHLIIGLSEPFFFSSYAQVASVWFPDHQVAMATAASLTGEEAGLALGFIIPPLMIGNNSDDFDAIQAGLGRLFLIMSIICVVNTTCIVLFFDDEPPQAPGLARARQIQAEVIRRRKSQQMLRQQSHYQNEQTNNRDGSSCDRFSKRFSHNLIEQIKLSGKFVSSKQFILLLIGFGINMGISYSLHTLLNQMIAVPPLILYESIEQVNNIPHSLHKSPDGHYANGTYDQSSPSNIAHKLTSAADSVLHLSRWDINETSIIVGNAGLILITAGLIGSSICGFLLDKYHKYKLTSVSFYLMCLISMAILTLSLLIENELILYFVTIPQGFALAGYASCAFDYGVEISYPKPELLSSTLLNLSAQIFGIPISLVGSIIVDNYGSLALGIFFCVNLAIGFVITCLQEGKLRRQGAVHEGKTKRDSHQKQAELELNQMEHRHQICSSDCSSNLKPSMSLS